MINDHDKTVKPLDLEPITLAIESIADALNSLSIDGENREISEAVRFAGERVEHGCCIIATAIDRLARCFEKD